MGLWKMGTSIFLVQGAAFLACFWAENILLGIGFVMAIPAIVMGAAFHFHTDERPLKVHMNVGGGALISSAGLALGYEFCMRSNAPLAAKVAVSFGIGMGVFVVSILFAKEAFMAYVETCKPRSVDDEPLSAMPFGIGTCGTAIVKLFRGLAALCDDLKHFDRMVGGR